MRVVVAGANGLIGKHLVARLRDRGDTVVALVRKAGGATGWARGAEVVEWDGESVGAWASALEGADAVVNMAGAPVAGHRWSPAYKQQILGSRVGSSRALVSALERCKARPKAFIAGSAIGLYGFHGDEVLDESAGAGADFLADVCRRWEDESRKAEALGVRTVLLRTGVVLARDGGALAQMVPPFRAFAGGPIGDGKQWLSWIHLDDELGLILWAIDREVRGPLNATAPEAVTMGEFCKALGRALGRPSWLPVPGFALRIALGEFANTLTKGQRVAPKVAIDSGYVFTFSSLASALGDLFGGARASAPAHSEAAAR